MGTDTKKFEAVEKSAASTVFTVYCHTHVESGRRYVGLTSKTMTRRWNQHVNNAKKKKKGWSHISNAIRKYGKEAFSHELIRVFNNLDDANLAEECLIKRWKTRDPKFGFNLMKGGLHVPHPVKNPWDRPGFREKHPSTIHHCLTPQARAAQLTSLRSPESKKKRSAATKAAMARPDVQAKRKVFQEDLEYRERISSSLKESLASPEARARQSDNSKKSATSDVIARRAASLKQTVQNRSPEEQLRVHLKMKEVQNRPEELAKRIGRVTSDETKAKISAASTGFRHTEESKAKMKLQFLERRDRILAESGHATWSDYIRSINTSFTI